MPTDDVRTRARALLELPIEGPWEVESHTDPMSGTTTYSVPGIERFHGYRNDVHCGTDEGLARFIAASRELVPELLAHADTLAAEVERLRASRTRRQYVAAYRAPNGIVIGIGEITGWREGAERDVEAMRSPDDQAEVFVAFRDLPDWQPISEETARD